MVERLKRWESPRKRGRNHKGKGGSARARQLRKQQQLLRKKLKENSDNQKPNQDQRRELNPPSIFLYLLNLKKVTLKLINRDTG